MATPSSTLAVPRTEAAAPDTVGRRVRAIFVGSVALMAAVQLGFLFCGEGLWPIAGLLLAFFVAFNILEATLPSLVTRFAPAGSRGSRSRSAHRRMSSSRARGMPSLRVIAS